MADCPNLADCPIFHKFQVPGLTNVWAVLYCQGDKQHDCARKKLSDAGKEAPISLLPNGKHLESLRDKD